MGIKTSAVVIYECDCCRKTVSQPFKADEAVLWSDRDVTATVCVSVSVMIPYSQQPNIICAPCAAKHTRAAADRIERTAAPADAEKGGA